MLLFRLISKWFHSSVLCKAESLCSDVKYTSKLQQLFPKTVFSVLKLLASLQPPFSRPSEKVTYLSGFYTVFLINAFINKLEEGETSVLTSVFLFINYNENTYWFQCIFSIYYRNSSQALWKSKQYFVAVEQWLKRLQRCMALWHFIAFETFGL